MERPLICLTLTGKTLTEDLAILNKYRNFIDMAELRADFLTDSERLHIRKFPGMAGLPCILTLRRRIDGGLFVEGEASRTVLFARAMSYASQDKSKNFQYVDFEEDFRVPSLQDAALAFGTKIIRSVHSMDKPIYNLAQRLDSLRTTGYEIPKIAFMPQTLDDVKNLFEEASRLNDRNHILIAMGPLGVPSRLLADRLKNYLTFTTAPEKSQDTSVLSHIDPVTMNEIYHVREINSETKLYGITGWPLKATSSPELHNRGYAENKINAVYVPVRAEKFSQALDFANTVGFEGLSVTIPHKEAVLEKIADQDEKVKLIGASNTIVKKDGQWKCYNTDVSGFTKSMLEFTGKKNLKHKKVAIIGAGGAACAVACAVKNLGADACVFNRTVSKAKALAEKYGFKYAGLSPEYNSELKKYSQIIVQTTSKGMNSTEASNQENDPVYFYEFTGKEMLFDIVYVPSVTPVMARAAKAGCRVINGFDMLKYQGWEQFKLFTGTEIDACRNTN